MSRSMIRFLFIAVLLCFVFTAPQEWGSAGTGAMLHDL